MSELKTTIVIPTYNEAENLENMASALLALPLSHFKLLIVDDNSPDGTGKIADRLAAEHPGRLSVMHRSTKEGLGRAYLAGFARALAEGADAVGQMDADFSHPPDKWPVMVAAITDCDAVIGSRYVPGGSVDRTWPAWRKWLSAFGNTYARTILNLPVNDATGGFRLYRRELLEQMPLERVRSNGYVFQVEMAYLAHLSGARFTEIPIYFADRQEGTSKMSLRIQIEAALRVWQVRFLYNDLKRS